GRKEYYGINLNIDLYDTGCGITEKQKNMLFGGVYLGNINEERKIGGLGLGIAIVEGLVNRMNGFIKIDSVPEKGTHIHISIPQKIANPEPGITMDRVSECNIIAYFNREKYTRSEVGAFYYELLNHAIDEFHFNITSAGSLAELKELFITMSITHVFIASWEYGMDPEYFESLAKHTNVCIFTHHDFKPLEGSCCDIIYKPIYVLSVIDYLKNSLENNFKREETNKSDLISVERPSFKGKRALVVDDDEMNLIVAKGILESMDVDVITCLSGDEAIEKCGITDFDIIFMDYMMPVMNGTKAMKHIREIRNGFYKEVPILVLTANAVSGAREEFMQAGFDEFISKPIDIIELGNTMKAFL
nr:response regulator [Butyrivibrio sp.]